jgi:hypothetical protein
VFIRSNREGSWGIYKESIFGGASKPMATGLADVSWTTPVSPDAKWLLYGARDTAHSSTRWMRVPLSGGRSEEIARGDDAIFCAHNSAGSCVAAEQPANGKKIVFKVLDPIKGIGQILTNMRMSSASIFLPTEAPSYCSGNSITGSGYSHSAAIPGFRNFR